MAFTLLDLKNQTNMSKYNKRGFLERIFKIKSVQEPQNQAALLRYSDPFIGEILLFAGNFAPRGWAFCHGQLLPINQNQALFALLGTTYGGNGTTNFKLPDLRGRVAIGVGAGHMQGEAAGQETHTLTQTELPTHSHGSTIPVVIPRDLTGTQATGLANANLQTLQNGSTTGASQSHNNVAPVLALNYIIAIQGIFPSRP